MCLYILSIIVVDRKSESTKNIAIGASLPCCGCSHWSFCFFSQQYLYGTMTRHLSYNDFINKELILFSNSDNERSIPSLVDGVFISSPALIAAFSLATATNYSTILCYAGMKPGQRKVLFTCLKRNDKREVKVAQLAGSVAEMSAYHHGEVCSNHIIGNIYYLLT